MREKPVRLNLELTPPMHDILEGISQELHTSKTDVIRRALELLAAARQAKKEGRKFGIAHKDQELATEFIGL